MQAIDCRLRVASLAQAPAGSQADHGPPATPRSATHDAGADGNGESVAHTTPDCHGVLGAFGACPDELAVDLEDAAHRGEHAAEKREQAADAHLGVIVEPDA